METTIKPNVDSWYWIIRSAVYPIFLVLLAALAGINIVDFDASKFEPWFACISYIALLLATLIELRGKPQKKNWFINQSIKTKKQTISVWSLAWLKFWLVVSLIVFMALVAMGN